MGKVNNNHDKGQMLIRKVHMSLSSGELKPSQEANRL